MSDLQILHWVFTLQGAMWSECVVFSNSFSKLKLHDPNAVCTEISTGVEFFAEGRVATLDAAVVFGLAGGSTISGMFIRSSPNPVTLTLTARTAMPTGLKASSLHVEL